MDSGILLLCVSIETTRATSKPKIPNQSASFQLTKFHLVETHPARACASAHIRTEANAITRCYTAVSIDNPSFKQKNRIKFIILVAAVGFIFDLFVVAADLLVGGKCFTNGR